ncbi:putative spermidine/putrescine transport system substrate-binding protein [Paraburkholderia unamae]|uniref:ABC transporter substrate-binding protein n=1 Tax=Paraburkholderia unamae TaxID=219649 RepID=UPI000DC21053|nr:ABC transporter substrate-binding protein [Paraburkholderia unamae]RAR57508.1 putative spermidine/putrescine transport system substrate-binding protein [Paraburkholderia unamae]
MRNTQWIGAVAVAVALQSLSCGAFARPLAVVNYGGTLAEAQQSAFIAPFQAATGIDVTASSYSGEQAKVKAMVDGQQVSWDVVEVESTDVGRGCDSGLYEHIDWSKVPQGAQLNAAAKTRCGVGIFAWANTFAYNSKLLQGTPTSWADFWNTQKFPGKRGMRKTARGNLEFALMADGVKPADVYKVLATPEGVDRAFRKLDALRPSIQWWDAGAQPAQFLVSGDVAMSTVFSGRIITAQKAGQPLDLVWNGAISDYDYWVIPKGSAMKDDALKFINYSIGADQQAAFLSKQPGGPANAQTLAKMSPAQLKNLPNTPEHAKVGVVNDREFWDEHGDDLDQRFAAWAAR